MVITRQDLTPGQQLAQTNHASLTFAVKFPELAKTWHDVSNYIVILAAKDHAELKHYAQRFEKAELNFIQFREPDLNNEITAICVEPSDETQRITSNLPLALRERPKADIIFHYNKLNITDSTIPPWVIKYKGETHYVNHLDVMNNVQWSTKETPNNEHTKGSLKFKGNLTIQNINSQLFAKIE